VRADRPGGGEQVGDRDEQTPAGRREPSAAPVVRYGKRAEPVERHKRSSEQHETLHIR